jgi:predicted 3-demethylubiquinone-9 3-methyltransferase (glyoxalase superfamily)
MTVEFLLEGQEFLALNGGPEFTFTPAISLIVNCETQEEVDQLWETLSEGGRKGECGWLEDRYGVSWQIVPTVLTELLDDPNPERSQRVMRAMLEMDKLDIARLRRAAEAA